MSGKFQVLTDGHSDGGIDEKLSYSRLKTAINAAKQYIANNYEGSAVYDTANKKICCHFGDFRIYELNQTGV